MPAHSSEVTAPGAGSPAPALNGSGLEPGPEEEWVSHQIRAMRAAWERGEYLAAEEVLALRPGLGTEDALRVVYEEVCLRREAGQAVAAEEVLRRFPRWEAELEALLDCDQLLWPLTRTVGFPAPYEQLGPFDLLAELGRGASGRTFLASEPALAARLVVLKLIPDDQEEHLSLARLQHTHIIPLFSEQTFADRGLRALCMPYVGGTTLAKLLEALQDVPLGGRSGGLLLGTLDQIQAAHPSAQVSAEGPYRRYLEQASYVEAICWITACLADGLREAHARGLVHMDVKPSNVLIAADGTPMLLDFHLARKPIKLGERVADRLGGTPDWMAPEQQAALEAVRRGLPVPEPVDHRTDLYALGLLMFEALGGREGTGQAPGGGPWPPRNQEVTVGLADIVRKCLAPYPGDRYRDAAALADDLRRHLNHLPLRGTVNRSLGERWRKWRRREPWALARAVAWSSTLGTLLVAGTLGLALYRQGVREAESDLEEGRRLAAERRYDDAARVLGRGLDRVSRIPATAALAGLLEQEHHRAQVGQEADELRRVADLVRFWYGTRLPAGAGARDLARRIQAIWDDRGLLLQRGDGPSDAEVQRGIRTDLRELAIVLVHLRARPAQGTEREAASRDALLLLDQVEATCGPSPAVDRERWELAQPRGPTRPAPEPLRAPQSAWEHDELGRSYLRSGFLEQAAAEFRKALDLRPQDFWPNFYQGHCAYELKDYATAEAAFRTCIALVPASAECYFNRGRASDALGKPREAFQDYSRALELNPQLAPAALNRGILSYKAGRPDRAIDDLERASRANADPDLAGRIHYNLALAQLSRGDRQAARASVQEALRSGYLPAGELREKLRQRP
jgi:serine/threonine protein kinase/Tfp pilus assembly protein PilF